MSYKSLQGKKVQVYYLKPHWLGRLSPMTDTRHITELRYKGRIIYSELQDEAGW